jgi:hypothetical protein
MTAEHHGPVYRAIERFLWAFAPVQRCCYSSITRQSRQPGSRLKQIKPSQSPRKIKTSA